MSQLPNDLVPWPFSGMEPSPEPQPQPQPEPTPAPSCECEPVPLPEIDAMFANGSDVAPYDIV